MAAFTYESAGRVRQKAFNAVHTQETGTATASSAGVFYALKALFLHLAANKGNPDLQFLPFSETECDAAGGTVIGTGAAKVYAVYIKKVSAATDNTFFLYDDATNDGTAGDAKIGLDLAALEEVAFAMYPNGLAIADGIVVTQYSDGIGATDGSDGGDGFVIISA